MSPAAYSESTPVLTAQRGGLAPTAAPVKMHPSEIALTLSADVLRLPYLPATRLVLAEIVSLYAATGLCDASDTHFAARLSVSTDTVSRAIKELFKDGLVDKSTSMQANGLYRTLKPLPAAIAAKAETNPYPQSAGTYPQNAAREATRKMPVGYPQNAGTPTRKMQVGVPAKCGSNTPLNIPVNFQETSISSADASAALPEKKIAEDFPAQLPADEVGIVPPVARPPRAKPAKPSAAAEPEHFAAFWEAYPRHDDRQKAVAAFARLSPEDQAAAPARAAEWIGRRSDWITPEGKDFRPYPATWLNNKRWKELAEPTPTPSPATAQPHAIASAHSKPGAARHHVPAVTSYGKL